MLNYVLRSKSLVEGGRGRMRAKYFFKLRREHARLLGEVGHGERVEALLAQRFELDVEEVRAILARLERGDGSLDVSVGENRQTALVETIAGSSDGQDERVDADRRQTLLQHAVREATRDLNERERVLVEQRLMADGDDERTLADISKSFGVSRERARQLETNVKNKLRTRLATALRSLDDSRISAAQPA
jgi:RNA polymerase sigma-32 factor